ncbi:MAG: bifunctional diaminohydroxyphosphoribosylaminopyrimidine deaminase/5-amino-6-(5-phosphoribosylamino)uracil reductase RibD [Crocinitomicaceae bacterium]|nr:bifunctional diaminohydroxyphosphoribosylaminopyrimidine deaminase/5-amino-6-(5-phosphoribosylamino)uracil reductase RibD [Crocinitomicaceae bacterium]
MTDEQYMQRCIDLARKGAGFVAPNPMVGCVIVHNDRIIGEGYHQKYGEAHAEVNAINNVEDPTLLKDASIYINLEPCAHFGKTPPCADLIAENKIPRVVIGCVDSYSEVAGKGIEKLKAAGCDVKVGILEKDSLDLNKRFFTFHTHKRPYVILKWAQSQDGFMDIHRNQGEKGTFWITAPETKTLVHQWRHEEAGILVGSNTILNDDPELTVREIKGNSPTRFYIDPENEIQPEQFKIGNDQAPTYKIQASEVPEILTELYEREIQSVIIEGGKYTLEKFLEDGTWDEARVLTGQQKLSKGLAAPKVNQAEYSSYYYGRDLIQLFRNA